MNETQTTEPAPIDTEDAAWVMIPAKQSPGKLEQLCQDVEALIRVNPYYVFTEKECPKQGDNQYHLSFLNLSNQKDVECDITITREGDDRVVSYSNGLKQRTVFRIEPTEEGSKLTIIDDYSGMSETDREQRQDEVDRSLTAWGKGLYAYFRRWHYLSWIPGWKWYTRKVWIGMNPSARRITYMLLLIEIAFLGLFGFSMLILWAEHHFPGW